MRSIVFVLTGLLLAFSPSLLNAADATTITLPCEVNPDQEAEIPAQEAGVLQKIFVREGDQVAEGSVLAQIDDVIPQLQQEVAGYKLDVARKQAEDDVDIRFASASANVAEQEYLQAKDANATVKNSVSLAETRRRALEWEKMKLSIEKARKDQAVAALQARVAEGDVKASSANIERRKLIAPMDAVVVELKKHKGEWVQAGEPVMRLLRMDVLRVDGFLPTTDYQYRASDIQGRPVRVVVTLTSGEREIFLGKIVYVKPVVASAKQQIRAEIQNQKQNGAWVLTPGLNAVMTIELK